MTTPQDLPDPETRRVSWAEFTGEQLSQVDREAIGLQLLQAWLRKDIRRVNDILFGTAAIGESAVWNLLNLAAFSWVGDCTRLGVDPDEHLTSKIAEILDGGSVAPGGEPQ